MKSPFFQFNPKGITPKQRRKLWYVFTSLKNPKFFTITINTKGQVLLVAQNPSFYFRRLTIGKGGGLLFNGKYLKCSQWLKR